MTKEEQIEKEKPKKKNILRKTAYFVILIIVMSIAGAIGEEAGNVIGEKTGLVKKPEIISETGLTKPQQDAFIEGCENAGSSNELCVCIFDGIRDNYSIEDFKTYSSNVEDVNYLPDDLKNVLAFCTELHQ